MHQEAQFLCHQVKNPGFFEASIIFPLSSSHQQIENFNLSMSETFFAAIKNEPANDLVQARINVLAFLLESFAMWFDETPDCNIVQIETKKRNEDTIQFFVNCVLNGKMEQLVFEFSSGTQKCHLVFSSAHHSFEAMQVALHIVANYLITQLNQAISYN